MGEEWTGENGVGVGTHEHSLVWYLVTFPCHVVLHAPEHSIPTPIPRWTRRCLSCQKSRPCMMRS